MGAHSLVKPSGDNYIVDVVTRDPDVHQEEPRAAGTAAELLGRSRELLLLRDFLAGSATDGGCLVLSGEPGVGKSALLAAAGGEARSAGTRVLGAAGVEFEADLSFSGLNQLLVPLHREFDQLGPVHREALSVALGFGTGEPADRLVVSTAAVMLLRQVAEIRPLLLVIDDLPWLDLASAGVLSFVARRLAGTRVGFLAAARTGEAGFFERVALPGFEVRPLDDDAAAGLLTRRFPDLAPRARGHLLAQAQGNPLALMELPVTAGTRDGSPGPVLAPGGRLRAHFMSRIARLPAQSRRLLLFAALHDGGDLPLPEVAGPGQGGLEVLAAAQQAGLVVIDRDARRLEFRHPLMRSAVVEVSTGDERRAAHRGLAALFADQPERRAWHLAEASVEPDEQVAAMLDEAAHRALRRGDAVGAVAALARAAELSPGGSDRSRRLAEAAYVGAEVTGGLRNVSRLLGDARQADPELNSLHAAVAASYLLFYGEGDIDTAHRLLVDAIATRVGSDVDDNALIEVLYALMFVCFFGGSPELWATFDAAISRLGTRVPEVLSLCSRTYADPVRRAAPALDQLTAAIGGLREDTDPTRIVRIGTAAFWVDRLADCRSALWRVVHDGRQGGAVASAIQALLLLGFDHYLTGQWDEAQQLFDEGVELCETHGYRLRAMPGRYGHALLAAARGDHDTVRVLTDDMNRWAALRGIRQAQRFSSHARTLVALGSSDFEYAYQHAAAVSPAGSFPNHVAQALWVSMDLVEAAVRTNRRAEADAHVDAMGTAGLARLSPRLALLTGGSAAIAASDQRAVELFREALAVPGAERWPFDYARVQLAYGERLRRSRATGESRAHLTAALDTFQRLRAQPWVVRAGNELRATGQTRSRTSAPGPASLTPQEREIAMLAAAGLTNKEIGERLFLSHRTVGGHLYRVFPKLGLTSRAGLRDALAVLPSTDDASELSPARWRPGLR